MAQGRNTDGIIFYCKVAERAYCDLDQASCEQCEFLNNICTPLAIRFGRRSAFVDVEIENAYHTVLKMNDIEFSKDIVLIPSRIAPNAPVETNEEVVAIASVVVTVVIANAVMTEEMTATTTGMVDLIVTMVTVGSFVGTIIVVTSAAVMIAEMAVAAVSSTALEITSTVLPVSRLQRLLIVKRQWNASALFSPLAQFLLRISNLSPQLKVVLLSPPL